MPGLMPAKLFYRHRDRPHLPPPTTRPPPLKTPRPPQINHQPLASESEMNLAL